VKKIIVQKIMFGMSGWFCAISKQIKRKNLFRTQAGLKSKFNNQIFSAKQKMPEIISLSLRWFSY